MQAIVPQGVDFKSSSIVTQKSIKHKAKATIEQGEKRVTWKCYRVVKLKQFLCTSTDNLHCIQSPALCLHMARISKTVNLNNSFHSQFSSLVVRFKHSFILRELTAAATAKNSEKHSQWVSLLMILLGLASFTQKPDKMDKLLTFCWKSHRIIWHFTSAIIIVGCFMLCVKLKYMIGWKVEKKTEKRKKRVELISVKISFN